jgi:mannobiose 2-epimerase
MSARILSLVWLVLSCASWGAANPSATELREQAARCRRILQESLVKFYLPACVDRENGGYLEALKGNEFVPTGEKFLTLQARQLWFFSALARQGIQKEQALAAAKQGYNFIETKFRDRELGGYFSKVSDKGEVIDARKHLYLNSFALYALTEYHRATKDVPALDAAKLLFRTLQKRAHDAKYGGFIEFFDRDWKEVTDSKAQGYVGAIGHKTYNTHLHLLESFSALAEVWSDDLLRRRVLELLAINTSTVHAREVNNNIDAWHRDWTVVNEARNLRASYGHDVECIWLALEAARAVGVPKPVFANWSAGLAESCLSRGYDREHGGFYSSGPLGRPADDLKKIWWVQAEALVGMLEMFQQTGNPEFYQVFKQTLDFCEQHQVAKEGSWWATLQPDGSRSGDTQRSSPWQGAYHAGRAMLISARLLEELASSNPAGRGEPQK